jgi:hypothetical protein
MNITPKSRLRHVITRTIVGIGLIAVVIAALGFAHAWYLPKEDGGPRCFETFAQSQFPKWLGCAMAMHENLAGGLVGAAGALFAAWIAFTAVQRQIEEETARFTTQMQEETARRERDHIKAKAAAVAALAHPVHAAALTLRTVRSTLGKLPVSPLEAKDALAAAVDTISQGRGYVDAALDNFVLREITRDLDVQDRARYIHIISTLTTLVATAQPDSMHFLEYLRNQKWALESVGAYLRDFDTELADVFERDSAVQS